MLPIAFYAPLKSPQHPTPSGDRTVARLLLQALGEAGFDAQLASHFRSYDGGDPQRQQRLQRIGSKLAQRLVRRYQQRPKAQRPRLWLSYHLYHKAPDWLGPAVSAALQIPYVVVEASYAAKQQQGPWQRGLEASLEALQQADLALCLNPRDRPGLQAAVPQLPLADLAPFIDLHRWQPPAQLDKAALAARYGLDPAKPWLVTVAMMRAGDKQRSYQQLAAAMSKLRSTEWELLLVGAGEAEPAIRQYFATLPRCHFLGQLSHPQLAPLLHASELLLWPALNEAFGMVFLEAQACGTAVVAGNQGGVTRVVKEGVSGRLLPALDSHAFATAIDELLSDGPARKALQQSAQLWVSRHHSVEVAAEQLQQQLTPLLRRC